MRSPERVGGRIGMNAVSRLLLELGLHPQDKGAKSCFEAWRCSFDQSGFVTFKDFLLVVRRLREKRQHGAERQLKHLFDRFDADKSSQLSVSEVSLLISEMGLQARSGEDQMVQAQILREVDIDSNGEVS